MTIRVLLIEDDTRLASAVVQYLEFNELVCDHTADGSAALRLIEHNRYDVIVSDVNMGRMSGFEFCRELRGRAEDTPVIMVTSRGGIEDKEEGFAAGADDYLTKPFELKELLLRVQVLVTRSQGRTSILKIDDLDLVMDMAKHTVTRERQPIELSKTNWRLLSALVKAWPNPVSKADLEFVIWGDDLPDSNGLKAHIHLLRQRLDKPFTSALVHSVPNFGYVLAKKV